MDASVYARVKKLQIISKKMSRSALVGDYASAFKGVGLEFDQLRLYVPGDDVRSIDWNASARTNETMVKTFVQERDRTVLVAVDDSESMFYGSGKMLKYDFACTVASAIGSIAVNSHDKFGAALFSETVDLWVPPARGAGHFAHVVERMCQVTSGKKKTSLESLFTFLLNQKNKRGVVVFVISDWLDEQVFQSKRLAAVARYYDLVALSVVDACEREIPSFGSLAFEDSESGQSAVLDTRFLYEKKLGSILLRKKADFLRKKGISHVTLEVGENWVASLARFFRERTRRQV